MNETQVWCFSPPCLAGPGGVVKTTSLLTGVPCWDAEGQMVLSQQVIPASTLISTNGLPELAYSTLCIGNAVVVPSPSLIEFFLESSTDGVQQSQYKSSLFKNKYQRTIYRHMDLGFHSYIGIYSNFLICILIILYAVQCIYHRKTQTYTGDQFAQSLLFKVLRYLWPNSEPLKRQLLQVSVLS